MSHTPIDDYGIIGNMRTVALVGIDGSLDWLCVPRFDSPSVFAALLDQETGGRFQVCPDEEGTKYRQFYWPDTNVLVTRFLCSGGSAELTDFVAIVEDDDPPGPSFQLIRRLSVVNGTISFRMACEPAFNYGRDDHTVEVADKGAVFGSPSTHLGLATSVPLARDGSGVTSRFELSQGEAAVFVLREIEPGQDCGVCLSREEAEERFRATVNYWRQWLAGCRYTGRWREAVFRSALVLKLLTYEPTGAIVAAPTTSLPEALGGQRNWDYRYTWIRDSAFTIYAFLRLGFTREAEQYMGFLARICTDPGDGPAPLQSLYGIDGRKDLPEESLDHLAGYMGSKPVRIGNAAYKQLQLDIFGEILDAAYLFNKYGQPVSHDMWLSLRSFVDWVCENWQRRDEGIWEVRSGPQDFVFSKVMCWVAVDRGLRLAGKRSLPCNRKVWLTTRDRIYEDVLSRGWNRAREAFVQSYGSDALDASSLIMPLVFFMSPTDPKMLKTIDAIMQPPERGGLLVNSLVYRYNLEEVADGLEGGEGTFNICTFWLVEALTRAGRFDRSRLEEARLIFERMLGFTNHLGLYAEEVGRKGEALGNFPQAFTHLAMISAAFNLDRALGQSSIGAR